MKILVTGDWQCSITNLDRCLILKDQIVGLLKASSKIENTFFLHLGDVKEAHNPVDVRVTNFIVEAFQEIRQNCTGIFFVKGNHDMISAHDGTTSCIPLIASLRATVADDNWVKIPIRLATWRPNIVKYLLLYMVPYVRNLEKQKQMFVEAAADAAQPEYRDPTSTTVSTDNIKILAFHNTVTGCNQNLYSKGTGINVNDLAARNYDICLGGHIHLAQEIPPNIIYVGSPFPMDWNECNSDHRILQITIDEKNSK